MKLSTSLSKMYNVFRPLSQSPEAVIFSELFYTLESYDYIDMLYYRILLPLQHRERQIS